MKTLLLATVALMLHVSCGANPVRPARSGIQENARTEIPVNEVASVATPEAKDHDVPAEFRRVDFQNRTYQVGQTNIRLSGGEFERREGGGGISFRLQEVKYGDLNSDGRKEAIVRLSQVVCGGSCDGGTDLFYFYSVKHDRVSLLTRLEIGSFAYDCGLKSFNLKHAALAIETFRSCRFTGSGFKTVEDRGEEGGKLSTNRYTQFTLTFTGRRFVQKERKLFSFPDVYDFRGHDRKIEISDE